MRTALTLGFKENGTAEIISGPEVDLNEQQRAFNDLTVGKSGYTLVQIWESDGGVRRSKHFGDKGTVNFNAAHLVENQPGKGKKASKKKLPDLTPTSGGGGGVDFNAAHPVEKQQDKKLSKKLPDLNKAQDQGATGTKAGVNFDSALPVEEQGKPAKAKKSSRKAIKTAPKKAAAEAKPEAAAPAPTDGPTL